MAVLNICANASGAVKAAEAGNVVVIVDVIDMSTTAESLLKQKPLKILGAAPLKHKAPVNTDPASVARYAADVAKKNDSEVIVVSEPRFSSEGERLKRSMHVIEILEKENIAYSGPYPNAGAEISNLVNAERKVVIIISDTGGLAFDAAFQVAGEKVITATIARTPGISSHDVIQSCVERIISCSREWYSDVSIVAASSNSAEDVLAAQFLFNRVIEAGFCNL